MESKEPRDRAPDPLRPLQNRVSPFGDLLATTARGTIFGNRGGRFHDPATRGLGTRRWAGKAWLVCNLHRSGVRRDVWGPSSYTDLFFLDEVTALAAGHRPCAFCRRPALRAYLEALRQAQPAAPERCPDVDGLLHAERLEDGRKRRHRAVAGDLPSGSVIAVGDTAFALADHQRLLRWSPLGWREAGAPPEGAVELLTPPTSVAALRGGFVPIWHPTAR